MSSWEYCGLTFVWSNFLFKSVLLFILTCFSFLKFFFGLICRILVSDGSLSES